MEIEEQICNSKKDSEIITIEYLKVWPLPSFHYVFHIRIVFGKLDSGIHVKVQHRPNQLPSLLVIIPYKTLFIHTFSLENENKWVTLIHQLQAFPIYRILFKTMRRGLAHCLERVSAHTKINATSQ